MYKRTAENEFMTAQEALSFRFLNDFPFSIYVFSISLSWYYLIGLLNMTNINYPKHKTLIDFSNRHRLHAKAQHWLQVECKN